MSNYKTLLVAVDLGEESKIVIERAQAICEGGDANIHLVHVIEPLSFAYGGDVPMDFSTIQDEIYQQAKVQISQLGQGHDIPSDRTHLALGQPEVEIHAVAKDLNADLIVMGCHDRYGLALLMGSTANGVLHGAGCDVLAVRVGNNS